MEVKEVIEEVKILEWWIKKIKRNSKYIRRRLKKKKTIEFIKEEINLILE